MLIAVTGATGFVGGRVVGELTRRGHAVVGYGRRAGATLPGGATYTRWDLSRGPIDVGCRVDAVVHCAGYVTDWGPDQAFQAVNLEGTRAVLETFGGTPRFIFVSSASVYDPRIHRSPMREDAAYPARYQNAYARTKMLAEQAVHASGRPAIVLRPHAVYGPGDRTLMPRLLRARRFGYLLAVGDGRNRLSVTHVDNLVHAIVQSIEAATHTGTFNIADSLTASLDELLRAFLRRLGLPVRVAYLPRSIAAPLAIVLERMYRVLHVANPPLLTPYSVSQLCSDYTLDIRRAQRTLGYRPPFTYLNGPLR